MLTFRRPSSIRSTASVLRLQRTRPRYRPTSPPPLRQRNTRTVGVKQMSVTDPGNTDIFDVDTNDVGDTSSNAKVTEQPVYQIYAGARIACSSSVGKLWDRRIKAAMKAYEQTMIIWDEVFKYYNNNQMKAAESSRGLFKRGDGTENVVFSNLNIMLPAVYSKDPDITCSTVDDSEEPFCKALEKLLNIQIRQKLRAKPKIKKCVGIGLLTNFGILKLDYTRKDDSRE